ncbi:unnamed protein product [Mycena citricolor]|uniref:Uncharacterized protein n=1 Tax=Mycena citricolor TaxID=2018698 RepID=A0AAD2H887_9AGAR|nr:unnamed protein product [Mycena citricolor]
MSATVHNAPGSLRSVGSNASLKSTSSLTRKPRIRARSKTVSSSTPEGAADILPPSPQLPGYLFGGQVVTEPAQEPEASTSSTRPVYQAPPSAFSRIPSVPQLYDLGQRDSVLTHGSGFTQSGGSSSLYPASSSTASGPPSPRSLMSPQLEFEYDAEIESQGYNPDDVSDRLRLLVKNTYFLPPAHSKPSSSDLLPVGAKRGGSGTKTPTTPTFFDLFRKTRSKPPTPTTAAQTFDFRAPALRTTSDGSAVTGYPPRRRSESQTPMGTRSPLPNDPSGRVVVVREKMGDLIAAARQAEAELKARGPLPISASQTGHRATDVIDPTDAVDLPPPSSEYPFAVQASALHEMGVQDSVGAAVLAERLPPPSSPSPGDDWRRALLHAAVDHSLNGSSVVQTTSKPMSPTSGLSSPLMSQSSGHSISDSSSAPISPGRLIGQRIISPPLTDNRASLSPSPAPESSDRRDDGLMPPRPSSVLPRRSETPLMPLTPLAPPPRKQLVNPVYSLSQTSLPLDGAASRESTATGSGRLSDSYEAGIRNALFSPTLQSRSHSSLRQSMESDMHSMTDSTVEFYSDAAPSAGSDRQPSIHSLDQFRPTMSSSPSPRDSAVSPPPRTSSSLANVITPLSPPPRTRAFSLKAQRPPRSPLRPQSPSPSPPVPPAAPQPVQEIRIMDPGPSTPPLPESAQSATFSTLSLEIPPYGYGLGSGARSAPPGTPPSFFDSIQRMPNAMDELESSDDEDNIYYDGISSSPEQTHAPSSWRTAANSTASVNSIGLTRLGNHSSPYISRSADGHEPVGNIASTSSFFTERIGGKWSDSGHGPPTSTFDFYQYTQATKIASSVDLPSTVIADQSRPSDKKTQDSVRRLDGMLLQHMEAEKDTLRRMAASLASKGKERAV